MRILKSFYIKFTNARFFIILKFHTSRFDCTLSTICRYDARDPNVNATTWSDKTPRGFGDRANFDPSKVQLSVNGIKAHEGGLYRCRVDFQRSQTSNVLVNLTVIGKGHSKMIQKAILRHPLETFSDIHLLTSHREFQFNR